MFASFGATMIVLCSAIASLPKSIGIILSKTKDQTLVLRDCAQQFAPSTVCGSEPTDDPGSYRGASTNDVRGPEVFGISLVKKYL